MNAPKWFRAPTKTADDVWFTTHPDPFVKYRAWYSTERNQPTRAEDNGRAIAEEAEATSPSEG